MQELSKDLGETRGKRKMRLQIERERFREKARPLVVQFQGNKQFILLPREFTTGSLGWCALDKMQVLVDGTVIDVQVTLNLTVIGSKDHAQPGWEKDRYVLGSEPTDTIQTEDGEEIIPLAIDPAMIPPATSSLIPSSTPSPNPSEPSDLSGG